MRYPRYLLKYLEKMAEKNSGSWHYCAYDVNGNQYEKIKNLSGHSGLPPQPQADPPPWTGRNGLPRPSGDENMPRPARSTGKERNDRDRYGNGINRFF